MIGIVFETATPFDTPQQMTELIAWLNQARELRRLHPLLIVAVFIVVFLAIHPFQDGNGRLSRVLTTVLLLQAGYAYVPYSSLESVIENSKEGYYLALRQTQTTIRTDAPNWQPWLLFFMRALQQQKRRLAVKVEREKNALAALAGTRRQNPRLRARSGPRHDARHGTRVRRKSKHAESHLHVTGRKRPLGTSRRRPVHLVRIAITEWEDRLGSQYVVTQRLFCYAIAEMFNLLFTIVVAGGVRSLSGA
jgi:hypothetical protein